MGNNDIKNINFLKTQQSKDRKAVYREKKRVKILELLPPSTTKKKTMVGYLRNVQIFIHQIAFRKDEEM